ncbi:MULTISPECIES: hypothetical protein [unclassified Neisseria]|uniref:hypothetical protein n=1 Tax=unclassified Neisseria TaxID=2623750 RepID=UPI002665BF24|nr:MULTISPECIES: hypothetical protein [unclassified Neisseria]MDO1509887.1 hypothetical protein [Neisseria sp. MVDL19-042950]MDO1516086.1 hypothetical protein [Neisseria sp. MVDL18-041461]MDO1563201.1 hypothetical protein [Neisseria sp. MVDL20-010259]
MKNWKQKLQYAVAVATTTALPAIAMADESDLLGTVKTELTGLKAGVLAIGVLAVGIGIAFATIRVGKRGSNAVG